MRFKCRDSSPTEDFRLHADFTPAVEFLRPPTANTLLPNAVVTFLGTPSAPRRSSCRCVDPTAAVGIDEKIRAVYPQSFS